MTPPPIPARWTGEAFEPMPGFARMADRHYVVGAVYDIGAVEGRSELSHRHEFAWLREAWRNLPERLADAFPTSEHLRKRALIDAGFFTETIIDAGANAAALRVAAYVRSEDEFALVIVRGPAVVIRKAKSQSRRAMGGSEFQASKSAVLDTVSALIGVEPAALTHAARAA